MMTLSRIAMVSLMALGLSFPALAQDNSHAHHSAEAVKDVYAPAMEKMHKDMMITPTGDADVDFMLGMIPHHQGAIDMAKIALEKGRDPEVKKLAEDVIAAQEKEIAFMKEWLKKRGH